MADKTREAVERLAHYATILAAPLVKGGEFEALRAHHEDTATALRSLLAEVARLTAALAEAQTRGAERMRARASNVAWACWADKEAETSRDHIANAIRALPLPPRERDGQEG